jgi:hypothetical protein
MALGLCGRLRIIESKGGTAHGFLLGQVLLLVLRKAEEFGCDIPWHTLGQSIMVLNSYILVGGTTHLARISLLPLFLIELLLVQEGCLSHGLELLLRNLIEATNDLTLARLSA